MKRLNRAHAMLATALWLSLPVLAHDYWLTPGEFTPAVGTETEILLCSGHSFPKHSTDTHGYRVHEAVMMAPGGESIPLTIEHNDKGTSARVAFQTNGTYMVSFSLAGPKKKEPAYWTRSLVVVGDQSRAEDNRQTGTGMEIVPGAGWQDVKVNDSLPLSVAYNGRTIRALISISREDGRVSHIRSSTRRPAMLKIKTPGRYLVIASVAGNRCSLTFVVARGGGSLALR
ncbi:MAG: DUF4198 domain-containing protein [Verrucomicrobia bacterium]|nr:DUF4198 domain-containing protein [Verrucomicrobiota bacterium]MBT7064736.1 DUF4198 domain-containing protein [Verrucomicrobiota bacterium]MBT7699184.1 DUF4198 domain-containing protein [Verrucomicrobiota bacterium]